MPLAKSPDGVFFLIMNIPIYIYVCVYLRAFLRLDHCGAAHCKKNIRSWGMGVNKCHWQGGRNPDGVA